MISSAISACKTMAISRAENRKLAKTTLEKTSNDDEAMRQLETERTVHGEFEGKIEKLNQTIFGRFGFL